MNSEDKKKDLVDKLTLIKMVGYPKLKDVAHACGKSNAAVTGWINSGNIDYLAHIDKISDLLGISINRFHEFSDQEFYKFLAKIKADQKGDKIREPIKAYNIEAITEEDKRENDVLIPVMNINHGMSSGGPIVPEFVETTKKLAFDLEWIRKKGYHQRDLKLAPALGDSMNPTIRNGDMVLINTAMRDIVDGKIYSLIIGDQPKFKILKRNYDGGLVVISENKDPIYSDEVIPPENLDQVYIIGRAVHRSGDL